MNLLNKKEIASVKAAVAEKAPATPHNIIMAWIDSNPKVAKRIANQGMIKPYAAYVIEAVYLQ